MYRVCKIFLIQTLVFFVVFSGGLSAYAQFEPLQVSTLSGTGELGNKDGKLNEASMRFPSYAVQKKDGTIIISDSKNHSIRKITVDGKVQTIAGMTSEVDEYGYPLGGFKDGNAETAMFNQPKGLAVDAKGNIYVVDSGNHGIRKIAVDGKITTLTTELKSPTDIVIANDGAFYVSDTLNHRIVKINQNGDISVVAGGGYTSDDGWLVGSFADGVGIQAKFNEPTGLAIDKAGNLYVADKGNQRIRKVTENGQVTTIAGTSNSLIEGTSYYQGGYIDGKATEAQFNYPNGLDVDRNGALYIADTYNHVIRKLENNQVSTVAGNGESGLVGGTERFAQFSGPEDILLLNNGDLLVMDTMNNRVRMIDWYTLPQSVIGKTEVSVVYNQTPIVFPDEQPKIVNGSTMVPVSALSNFFNYDVKWDGENQKVYISKDGESVVLQIGNKEVIKSDGTTFVLNSAPFIQGQRTHVPVRFISEAFEYQVDWMGEERAVLLRD